MQGQKRLLQEAAWTTVDLKYCDLDLQRPLETMETAWTMGDSDLDSQRPLRTLETTRDCRDY